MSRLYDFNQYDRYFSLKVNTGLWLVMLYLMRPYIVLIGTMKMGRGSSGAVGVEGVRDILYPDNFSIVLAILATIPALLFMYAWSRRKPGAGALVIKLWKQGANLLGAAAAMNIVIVFVPWLTGAVVRIHALGWVQVGFAIVIIGYLYSSRRARDTFADFPVEKEQ